MPTTREGQVALVTGGARRVGRAIVEQLVGAGFDVAIHCRRSRDQANALADWTREQGCRAAVVQGELGDPATWPRIVEETASALGGLDVLINNAATFATDTPDTLDDFDEGRWRAMLGVNLLAPVALCRFARTHLERSGHGCVVNLLDIAVDRPWPDHLAYCASKAGLAASTRALARAMAPRVRVIGIAPGIAGFPEDYDTALRERITRKVPLAREGTPGDVARIVRALVIDGAYITGEIIRIDGGRHLS